MNRIRRSAFHHLFCLVVLLTGALAAGSLWLWPEGLPQAVTGLLPWRILLWAAASAWAGGQKWREGRRAAKG